MNHQEQWSAFEQQFEDIAPTSFIARVVVQDICKSILDPSDKAALRGALLGSPQVMGSMASVEQHEDQSSAIIATAVVDGTSQADAIKTIAVGLTKGFDSILWDPESVELKAAFVAPERAIPASIDNTDIIRGDSIEQYPIDTLITLNPAGDVLVEMDAGEVYYMAREQYLA